MMALMCLMLCQPLDFWRMFVDSFDVEYLRSALSYQRVALYERNYMHRGISAETVTGLFEWILAVTRKGFSLSRMQVIILRMCLSSCSKELEPKSS